MKMLKNKRFECLFLVIFCVLVLTCANIAIAEDTKESKELETPVIKDGQTQIVKRFEDSDRWIRHDLWVVTEFDSDDDGKPDRMHVDVTRQRQTETEGLKVAVIYGLNVRFWLFFLCWRWRV
jgi:X-Pro dipeptidyl-peptidase